MASFSECAGGDRCFVASGIRPSEGTGGFSSKIRDPPIDTGILYQPHFLALGMHCCLVSRPERYASEPLKEMLKCSCGEVSGEAQAI
jgi:hypothetical protein